MMLEYVSKREQVVDIFIKPLSQEHFEYLRQKSGVMTHSSLHYLSLQEKRVIFQIYTRMDVKFWAKKRDKIKGCPSDQQSSTSLGGS